MQPATRLEARVYNSLILQDNTMRAWDMRPYAPQNRCVKVFTGHQHSFERNSLRCDWSPDGTKVGPLPLSLSHTAFSCLQQESASPNGDKVEPGILPIIG